MISLSLSFDTARLHNRISDMQRRQLPFITVQAVNGVAKAAVADLRKSMQTAFDRPTPWTLNSVYAKTAHTRQANPTAYVGIKEFAPGGTPAWKYLGPQMDGGLRRQKRFEKLIEDVVPGATFAVPGRGAKLDAYGNISRGQLNQVLSELGAFKEQGYQANATQDASARKKRLVHPNSFRKASPFFVVRSKTSGKPTGVFQIVSKGNVVPVLSFTDKAPEYEARWSPMKVVDASVQANRDRMFWAAFHQAMATAK